MNRWARSLLVATMTGVLAVTASAGNVMAAFDEGLAEELLTHEQAKLDPWYGEASTEVYVKSIADDSTWFDPWVGKLQGADVIEYLEGFEGKVPPLGYEITDLTADVRGELVILSYIIENSDPETGEPAGTWMVTKVLNQAGDSWEVIHTQYGLPSAPPEL